jgi:hypothetical protein
MLIKSVGDILRDLEAQGFIEHHVENSPWGNEFEWWDTTRAGLDSGIVLIKKQLPWQLSDAPPWLVEIFVGEESVWKYEPVQYD